MNPYLQIRKQIVCFAKFQFIFYSFLFLQSYVTGQVSTTPGNKNFLIEKGTGHVCGSCPGITMQCENVINSHPGRGMLIEYHFGPDAIPQLVLPEDFTTPYGDTIFDPSGLAWPFYLNMMMNRRDQGIPYGSTFIFGTVNQVQPEADTLVNQPSSVNLAMSSVFDSTTRLLTVHVEVYYTASSATTRNFIQVVLTEDSIIAMQLDPSYPLNNNFNPYFNHMNTFRDNLNGFGGDTIFTTTMGTMVTRTYTYTIPASYKNIPCVPTNCNLTLYVAEERAATGQQSFTGKIITAIRSHIGESTVTAVPVADNQKNAIIYPNPSTGLVWINSMDKGSHSIEITDLWGKSIYSLKDIQSSISKIDLSHCPQGLYLVKLVSSSGTKTYKISINNRLDK
jgi:hypothetical protein